MDFGDYLQMRQRIEDLTESLIITFKGEIKVLGVFVSDKTILPIIVLVTVTFGLAADFKIGSLKFLSFKAELFDTFHDYEPCLLAKYLYALPAFHQELDKEFLEEHNLIDLMKVISRVPPLETPYVPRNSLIREFVGGSTFKY